MMYVQANGAKSSDLYVYQTYIYKYAAITYNLG